ncbi:ROK family protein [Syntrophobotulus glycolicus DSM 8271]|uniref:ROK family protein n=1 Tax=Syntrophobotulus glycolicus (strain DSM 8271 / FlGlyR) TaxID=645991 RepID=F0SYR8_SYNGF|nr:ROK family protein [Syntrophobotulus glycolicus]ADY54869.1 ROK family protein [Syntrophobotulus glycolicus DSM 8271]
MKNKNLLHGLSDESKRILKLFLHKGAMTKKQLSKLSGLKLTTLNRMMLPLEDLNLIVKSDIEKSSGGRKPALYDVNVKDYYLLGVDISRLYTQIVLTNLKMKPLEKYRFDMNQELTPEATLKRILEWIQNVLAKIKDESVLGIGIGTVGPLDRENGVIINPENFEAQGWKNIAVKSIFEEKLGLPVLIDNGANAAVLAEANYGIGKGIKNIMYLNCGVGIRTGFISSGIFVRTVNDSEDTFAHTVIDVKGKECRCGNHGCIEKYSSIHAILEEFADRVQKGGVTRVSKPARQISYLDICRAAEDDDPLSAEVIQNAALIMGTGLANFIQLFNPGIVVLSGPLIRYSKLFYEECVRAARRKSFWNQGNNINFSRGGSFAENAISIGSAALVVENLFNHTG